MEEMLHLTLASNLLNAIGGHPQLVPPRAAPPSYPTYMPHSDDAFTVNLLPFSRGGARDLSGHRASRAWSGRRPRPTRYHTIAQFYEAIGEALTRIAGDEDIFTGSRALQVESAYYYGGGGESLIIHDLRSAQDALELITFEGEGIDQIDLGRRSRAAR